MYKLEYSRGYSGKSGPHLQCQGWRRLLLKAARPIPAVQLPTPKENYCRSRHCQPHSLNLTPLHTFPLLFFIKLSLLNAMGTQVAHVQRDVVRHLSVRQMWHFSHTLLSVEEILPLLLLKYEWLPFQGSAIWSRTTSCQNISRVWDTYRTTFYPVGLCHLGNGDVARNPGSKAVLARAALLSLLLIFWHATRRDAPWLKNEWPDSNSNDRDSKESTPICPWT